MFLRLSGKKCCRAVHNPSETRHGAQPHQVELAENEREHVVRGHGTEQVAAGLQVVQRSPGGVTAIQVEHAGVAILSFGFDGVVVGQKRVDHKPPEIIYRSLLTLFQAVLYS